MDQNLSIFLNSLLMSFTGVSLTYAAMRLVFPLRRRPYLWWGYFLIRAAVDGLYNICFLNGASGTLLNVSYVVFISGTAVITFFVHCSTFDADLLHAGLGAFLSDMASALCVVAGVSIVNVLCGRDAGASYQTPLRPDSIPTVLMCMAVFCVAAVPWRFVMRKFRFYRFRFERIWLAFLIMMIALFTGMQFTDLKDITVTAGVLLICLGVILSVSILVLRSRTLRQQQDRSFEERQVKLLRIYQEKVYEQLQSLEKNREVLRTYEEKMRKMDQWSSGSSDVRRRFEKLQKEYDTLLAGQYTDNMMLDAVLSETAQELKAKGIRPVFSAMAYRGKDEETARIAMRLLTWAQQVFAEEGEYTGVSNEKNRTVRLRKEEQRQEECTKETPEKTIHLGISEMKNQVIVKMLLSPVHRVRFPGSRLLPSIRHLPGSTDDMPASMEFRENWDSNVKEVTVMVEKTEETEAWTV